jgi:hypothetical protein
VLTRFFPSSYHYQGFIEFERELILGCTNISSLYGAYYFSYLEAVQDPAITTKLVMDPPSPDTEGDCYSHYTIVKHSEEGGYSTVSFAAHFAEVLAPILAEMDALVAKLQAVSAASSPSSSAETLQEHAAYIAFFQHYRLCHSSDVSAAELEELWSELDRKWMNMKVPACHDSPVPVSSLTPPVLSPLMTDLVVAMNDDMA